MILPPAIKPFTTAALAFAHLDALGLGNRTAILDGGWLAWRAAGGGSETGAATSARTGASARTGPVFVDRAFVAAHLRDPAVLLIAARVPANFSGHLVEQPGEPPGHIPGAVNLPFTALATADGYFRARSALVAAFRHAGARYTKLLIVYCHSGRKAAVDYVAARLLGYKARIYGGSWRDWNGLAPR